jgi:hypothetical protein
MDKTNIIHMGGTMVRWIIWGIALLIGLAFIGYGGYNLFVPEKITFVDETGLVNEFAVNTLAETLRDRGARVAVYFVEQGDAEDFQQRLEDEGLLIDGENKSDLIAVYATLDYEFTAVYLGEIWYNNLTVSAEDIRVNKLNPPLLSGEYTRGYVDALTFVNASLPNEMEIEKKTTTYIVALAAGLVAVLGLAWYAPQMEKAW